MLRCRLAMKLLQWTLVQADPHINTVRAKSAFSRPAGLDYNDLIWHIARGYVRQLLDMAKHRHFEICGMSEHVLTMMKLDDCGGRTEETDGAVDPLKRKLGRAAA